MTLLTRGAAGCRAAPGVPSGSSTAGGVGRSQAATPKRLANSNTARLPAEMRLIAVLPNSAATPDYSEPGACGALGTGRPAAADLAAAAIPAAARQDAAAPAAALPESPVAALSREERETAGSGAARRRPVAS